MRVPWGGGASCLGVGRPGSGALPAPTARPLGGLPGPTTHLLWVRGAAGVGTRPQPHSARSCELALRAVGAAGGRPGGAPPAWVWGVRGRALSHPRLPALWAGRRGPAPEKEESDLAISESGAEGLNRDGTLTHSYPDDKWVLVPLRHWNWKWNQARGNYSTYEQELLAGGLVLSSQPDCWGVTL